MRYLPYGTATAILIMLSFASVSCTDLTEVPSSEITSENFNPTADDIGALMAPSYSVLRNLWMGSHQNIALQEESGDALVTPVRPDGWYDGGTYIRMHKHTWDETQSQPEELWNNSFRGINAANRVINQIEAEDISLTEEIRQPILAELKVLRAYYYFLLLDGFGNVPIVTDFTSEELPEQNTRQEVYDFVVSELISNIPRLSETADQSMYGRMNKWAGKALLARIYLNAGVYTGTPQYEKVIPITNDIINSDNYDLEGNYTYNFSRDNENSAENIWAVVYDEINLPGNDWHMKTSKTPMAEAYGMRAAPWGGSGANPQFINTYEENDSRLEDSWISGELHNEQGEILMDIQKNIPSIDSSQNYHGYALGKYEIYFGITVNSDVDLPIFRYAEVLMMKAESLLRTGSPDQAAELVTQVRERAFEDPLDAQVTGAELMEGSTYNYGWWEDGEVVNVEGGNDIQYGRMLDELGWEFAIEGHRRRDMIRFGVYTTKTWFNHEPGGDHLALFPIPRSALSTNTNLEQNPGY